MTNIDSKLPLKSGNIKVFILLRLGIGIGFICLFVYLSIRAMVIDQEVEFVHLSANSLNRLQEQLVVNEAALVGFANMLKISGPHNLEGVLGYTQHMRDTYSQIYMFEALIGLHPDDQYPFARKLRASSGKDYKIYRYVPRNSKTGRQSKPFNYVADTPVMFPIFFIDPNNPKVESLLGFDMMSAKIPREPLIEALLTGETRATRPYALQEGGMGYVLYTALDMVKEPSGSDAVGIMVAAVLIRTDPIMKLIRDANPLTTISLMYGDKRKLAAKDIILDSNKAPIWVIKRLSQEVDLNKYGQPFTLVMTQNIGLYSTQVNLLVALVLLLSILFLLYLRTSLGRRKTKLQRDQALVQLAEEHDLLEERVVIRTQELQRSSDENKRLAYRIVRLQEEHSHNLARELHDDFGQLLTAIKTNAHIINQMDIGDKALDYSREIFQYADGLYTRVHDLIQFLRPEVLDTFGLQAAIRQCLAQFKLVDLKIHLDVTIDDAVDNMNEAYTIATYRIVQELINNIVKHAEASYINVSVQIQDDTIIINVTDDGKGFDPETLEQGFGLNGVVERVKTLSGEINFISAVNQGVSVRITIPLTIKPSVIAL